MAPSLFCTFTFNANVNEKIIQYQRVNKEGELEKADQALRQNSREIRGREEIINQMKPEIDNLKKQVEDV